MTRRDSMRIRALSALAFLMVAAQLAGAELSGAVIDGSGLALPGAAVKLETDQVTRSGQTDNRGAFHFTDVPEGPCHIHVERLGFRPFDQTLTGKEGFLSIQLAIETRHDSVVVKASPDEPGTRIGSLSLDSTELKRISNDPKVWVNYAQTLAGAANLPTLIYVDGLPLRNCR